MPIYLPFLPSPSFSSVFAGPAIRNWAYKAILARSSALLIHIPLSIHRFEVFSTLPSELSLASSIALRIL